MQLRRFTADSTPAALGAVRLALGDDAIILANRRLGDQVEIIATGQIDDVSLMATMSVDELTSEPAVERAPAEPQCESTSAASPQHAITPVLQHTAVDPHEPPAAQALKPVGEGSAVDDSKALSRQPVLPDDTISISQLSREIDAAAQHTQALNLQDPPHCEPSKDSARLSVSGDSVPTDSGTRLLESLTVAMESQAQLINQHFKSLEIQLWGNSAPSRSVHLQRLLGMGIGAELAIRLVEKCTPGVSLDEALRQSFAVLKSSLPTAHDKSLQVNGVTIMSGPPGAGKTTALIKLATEHVRRDGNQSIVIICADTRRIGAFEELQAYGRLLGVPTVHAHDAAELSSLIAAFTHKALVLIDHTLPADEQAVQLPASLLQPTEPDSVRHLFTLPATIQASTADALIARHCRSRSIRCVLTHLDASARLAEVFNALIRHNLPVAYWSDSASVQRPLQRADASVLVATAVAMSRRIALSVDDQWLQRLVQPSNHTFAEPLVETAGSAYSLS